MNIWKRVRPPKKYYAPGDCQRWRLGPMLVSQTNGIDGVKLPAPHVLLIVGEPAITVMQFRKVTAAKAAAEKILKLGDGDAVLGLKRWRAKTRASVRR